MSDRLQLKRDSIHLQQRQCGTHLGGIVVVVNCSVWGRMRNIDVSFSSSSKHRTGCDGTKLPRGIDNHSKLTRLLCKVVFGFSKHQNCIVPPGITSQGIRSNNISNYRDVECSPVWLTGRLEVGGSSNAILSFRGSSRLRFASFGGFQRHFY